MVNRVQDKRVLVTGGAGFIGSNLCESLVAQGNDVVCFDNLATGFQHNIAHLSERFSFINGDINDSNALKKAMEGVEVVFHQAALGSVPRSINDPLSTNRVNITGFLNLLETAKSQKVKRVVYASSSSVYGDIADERKVESRTGVQLSPYAVSKYANELYAAVFSDLYDLELIGLRYFNVFGRRQTPDGPYAAAIPRFIDAFINGRSPVVFGDGNQTRDFTYIDNVIRANNLAAVTDNKEALGEVFNVACGQSISVNSVLDILKKYLADYVPSVSDIAAQYDPPRIGDVRASLASIDKAEALLGYKPALDFEMGIKEAIDWYYKSLS